MGVDLIDKQKIRAKIYQSAAELIFNNTSTFSCIAIMYANGITSCFDLKSYPELLMFKPKHKSKDRSWFSLKNTEKAKEQRIFCLLSCAEFIKQGIEIE